MPDDEGTRSSVRVRRIVLAGVVDRKAIDSVTDEVRTVLGEDPEVQIDATQVDRWSEDALQRLASCARLGRGVEIRIGGNGRSTRTLR